MGWMSLLAIAVALAMDAFAVAMATTLALDSITGRHVFRLSFHFGLFQALMLMAGWLLGSAAYAYVSSSDHWIAFGLLAFVGARMIWGAVHDEQQSAFPDRTRSWDLVLLSIATSIDALAVGLSLAMVDAAIAVPAVVVGAVAAALTFVGMVIGRRIGLLWGKRVEVLGGCVLVAIGLRIVWQHIVA
jgi:putative Mn2+ efflux pump MntP